MNTGLMHSMRLRMLYTQKAIFETVTQAGWPRPGAQSARKCPAERMTGDIFFAIHQPGENEGLLAIHTKTMLLLAEAGRQLL